MLSWSVVVWLLRTSVDWLAIFFLIINHQKEISERNICAKSKWSTTWIFFNFPEEQLINIFVYTWVYNMMIWLSIYVVINEIKIIDTAVTSHVNCVCVCVWQEYLRCPLSNFQVLSTTLLTIVTTLYTGVSELILLLSENLCIFTYISHFPFPTAAGGPPFSFLFLWNKLYWKDCLSPIVCSWSPCQMLVAHIVIVLSLVLLHFSGIFQFYVSPILFWLLSWYILWN